eukprot:COSAG01_NODE_10129_length_2241_cov_11.869342_1_plen_68_part_10
MIDRSRPPTKRVGASALSRGPGSADLRFSQAAAGSSSTDGAQNRSFRCDARIGTADQSMEQSARQQAC